MGDITRIGVIGAGLMGSGIAEVAARAGRDVVVVEANAAAADAGRERIEKSLARGVEKGGASRRVSCPPRIGTPLSAV
jgi:3-hydroxybutyryl-CoA dehydrogenase